MPLPDPVFLLVPHRHFTGSNSGSVFSQLPTNGTGDFIFTRSTIGSYVNSSGFITTSSIHEPRIKHFYTGSNDRSGFLIEPTSTNLIVNSEAINLWQTASMVPAISNSSATVDPSNKNTSDKIIADATINAHYVLANYSPQVTGSYTFSIFAKAAEYNFLRIQDLQFGMFYANVNLTNGEIPQYGTSVPGKSPKFNTQNYGNGWYRCIVTYEGDGRPISIGILGVPNSSSYIDYLGDGTSGVYVWGAQLETGTVATSYIPTTTTSVTRNADVLTDTSYTLPTPSGSIYTEFNALSEYSCFVNLAGPILITTGSNRIAITYTNSNISVYKNGAFVVSQSAPNTIGGNIINLGHSSGSFQLNDTLRGFAIYNTPLSAPDAILLTSGSNRRYL